MSGGLYEGANLGQGKDGNGVSRNIKVSTDGFLIGDTELEIARGKVPGVESFSKFGENPSVDTADGFADIWLGKSAPSGTQKYVAPTQARNHDCVSDDAADAGTVLSSGSATGGSLTTIVDSGATFVSDSVAVGDIVLVDTLGVAGKITAVTSETVLTVESWFDPNDNLRISVQAQVADTYRVVTPGSTGASLIFIEGLNNLKLKITEFVVLDGVTPVASSLLFWRINRAIALGFGSGNEAAGIISGKAQTDNTVSFALNNGDNQTLQAIYSVPINQDAFLKNWQGSVSKKQAGVANLRLRVGDFNSGMYVADTIVVHSTGSSNFNRPLQFLRVRGGTDILIEADVDTNGMGLSGGFDFILVDVV